jgi:predicted  nucleic acid-binding Zn-ribbon protein
MNIPFDMPQTITLLLAFATAVSGYAELKLSVSDTKKRVDSAEKKIDDLQQSERAYALLAQAVDNLANDVRSLEGQMKTSFEGTQKLNELFARIDERLKMERPR